VTQSFLGRGWSFPPSFEISANEVEMLADEEDVKSSLGILLTTMRGERVMQPLYGCNVESQLFEPLDTRQKTLLKDMIESAVVYHEPRVELENVAISDDNVLEGLVEIELSYRLRTTNSRFNVVYPFYSTEATDAQPPTGSETRKAGP